MNLQLQALVVVGGVVLAAACLEMFRAQRARRRSADAAVLAPGDPYIIYFTGESCTACRTHQEPALAKLNGVRIDKVDAVADRALADQFHVYMLPTTVVMGFDGRALHVNYGYAPVTKLERQLAEARGVAMGLAATT